MITADLVNLTFLLDDAKCFALALQLRFARAVAISVRLRSVGRERCAD